MNAKTFFLFATALLALPFASCSDDDDNAVETVTISSLEGEFVGEATGTMVIISQTGEESSSDVTPQGTETATITVDAEKSTITLTQPTFYVGNGVYPGAIVRDIPAVLADGVVTFSINDYGSMNGYYTVAGDLSGTNKDKLLTLDYTFKHAGQMVGTIHFEGKRK